MAEEDIRKKKIFKRVLITVLTAVAVILLALITYFLAFKAVPDDDEKSFSKAAIASSGYLCAKIGRDVMQENGTAVDAALAVLICEGALCLQSMGIGGGFLMTIYDKKSGKVEVLNARESAPLKASENMYAKNVTESEIGGLSVAVPSELKGYHAAYEKYGGGVSWKRLFEPTIKICYEGFKVNTYLAEHIKRYENDILKDPIMKDIFFNSTTNQLATEGDVVKRPHLGKFLEIIANEGITPFYEGAIAKKIVEEVQEKGGILTEEDLKSYTVQWMEPVHVKWGPYKMYTSPLPGSGELLVFMLNLLRDFIPFSDNRIDSQRFIETFKWAYGKRTELGDISETNFVPNATYIKLLLKDLLSEPYAYEIRKKIKDYETSQDPKFYGAKVASADNHGTCHISVMSENGDAVSVTSTINLVFGARFASKSTGIIFNDEMADFSVPEAENPYGMPPSPANFIKPRKRPLSSMCPTIFLNENDEVVLVIGGSGGTRITSSVAYVVYQILVGNKSVKKSIDLPRLHHQLFPMSADFEVGFPQEIVQSLHAIGHKTTETGVRKSSSVTAVGKFNGKIFASYDYRRGGSVDGY